MSKPEYLYRFRIFVNPANTDRRNAGWTEWELIDEKKYNEVVVAIHRGSCLYQAQKLLVEVEEDHEFDLAKRGFVVPIYQMITRTDSIDAPVSQSVEKHDIPRLRTDKLMAGDWVEFEVSFNNGKTWESY